MEEVLQTETRGAVRLLILNRPKKLNALDANLLKALTDALLAVQRDDSVAAVIIAGAGRAFCPGMDTSAPRVLTMESRKDIVRRADESIGVFKLLARIDKPIIAAVHGYALGAGCSLAFGCDLVVAGQSARFGFPELRAGLTASTVTAHAVHVMGRKIAFELLMLCENITPQRAYELGLVNRVVADDQLLPTALEMAEIIAKWNPEFVGQTKRTFHRAASLSIEQALEMAGDVSVMMARLS
ncbi:MAG: enoyl-CoA hydratase/isomerase family protein [Alphaproteobacteria bacterium]|nr:enoyl-CoA hydratase/isomerase family protein [Alphaproteobacteria bacterium]